MVDPNSRDANFWAFRDGRKTVCGRHVLRDLLAAVKRISQGSATSDFVISALILTGELESALADSDSPDLSKVEQLTNALATALQDERLGSSFSSLVEEVSHLAVPQEIVLSPAEGFAYYALHPLDFAALAEHAASPGHTPVAVIGIRSIGTTRSAIAAAACRRQRRPAERMTVRPTGHPYNRSLEFTARQREWVRRHKALSAD